MTKAPRQKHDYVDNKQLHEETAEWVKARRKAERKKEPLPQMPEYTAKAVIKIAERLADKPNFYSYTFKDEMIADGIEYCVRYLHNYNPEKSTNCFAYITQIISNAFIRRIQTESKQSYIRAKIMLGGAIVNPTQDGDDRNYERRKSKNDGNVEKTFRNIIERYEGWKESKRVKSQSRKEQPEPEAA